MTSALFRIMTPARESLLLGVMLAAALPIAVKAQEMPIPPHSSSTLAPNARYEIVQSHLAAKWTFRLDRVCGFVSQLVKTRDGGAAWEAMPIEKLPNCVDDSARHYQLFSSSLAARHTFLMNTDTGTTWVLTTHVNNRDKSESTAWELFE
jgi:hypothetical protein